jgi:hypothetical protein
LVGRVDAEFSLYTPVVYEGTVLIFFHTSYLM